MDYIDNNTGLFTDIQIDRYYNDLKDFNAYNIPNQISSSISIVNNHLDYINEELNTMNSNRIAAEKEEVANMKKKLKAEDEYLQSYLANATRKIDELKALLKEFEILKPSVLTETKDEYKTAASNEDMNRLNELRTSITNKVQEIKKIANENKAVTDNKVRRYTNTDSVVVDSLDNKPTYKENEEDEKESQIDEL